MTKPRPIRGFTLIELLVVIALIAVLTALCLPAMQHARDEARRTQCLKNLKTLGQALRNYNDTNRQFPPGWTQHHPQPGPETRFGWAVFILPFTEKGRRYDQIIHIEAQRAEPLNLFQPQIAVYRCPEDPTPNTNSQRGGFGTMNYSANFGPVAPPRWLANGLAEFWPGQTPTHLTTFGLAFLNSRVRERDIVDGMSWTMQLGERSAIGSAAIWMGVRGNEYETDQVTDCSPGHEINSGEAGFSSLHNGGANFLFCDGSVRFLSEKIESGPGEQLKKTYFGPGEQLKTYQKLSHRNDGSPIDEF